MMTDPWDAGGTSNDAALADHAPGPGAAGADEVTDRFAADIGVLLDEVDDIARMTGDSFDLDAITRQAELLEQAHEALTAALDDVDRR